MPVQALTPVAEVATATATQLIKVKTDVLNVKINTQGGDIVALQSASLYHEPGKQSPLPTDAAGQWV